MSQEPYDAQSHSAESLERIADALETLVLVSKATLARDVGKVAVQRYLKLSTGLDLDSEMEEAGATADRLHKIIGELFKTLGLV